jgi:hypothetical protein
MNTDNKDDLTTATAKVRHALACGYSLAVAADKLRRCATDDELRTAAAGVADAIGESAAAELAAVHGVEAMRSRFAAAVPGDLIRVDDVTAPSYHDAALRVCAKLRSSIAYGYAEAITKRAAAAGEPGDVAAFLPCVLANLDTPLQRGNREYLIEAIHADPRAALDAIPDDPLDALPLSLLHDGLTKEAALAATGRRSSLPLLKHARTLKLFEQQANKLQRIFGRMGRQITPAGTAQPRYQYRGLAVLDVELLSEELRRVVIESKSDELRKRSAGEYHNSGGDKPRSDGYVKSPVDPAAYVPAAGIVSKHTPLELPISPKELVTIVEDYDAHRVRWTRPLGKNGRPVPNRRSVHLGDWLRYLRQSRRAGAGEWPRLSGNELEQRKAAVRDARHAGK